MTAGDPGTLRREPGGSAQGMSKANRFILTMPACVTVDAIGFVDPCVSGSNSPPAFKVNCSVMAVVKIRSPS
jgi:hypothetical protein